MGQAWGTFDKTEMDRDLERGAIPLVTMGLGDGVTLEQVAAGGPGRGDQKLGRGRRRPGGTRSSSPPGGR